MKYFLTMVIYVRNIKNSTTIIADRNRTLYLHNMQRILKIYEKLKTGILSQCRSHNVKDTHGPRWLNIGTMVV